MVPFQCNQVAASLFDATGTAWILCYHSVVFLLYWWAALFLFGLGYGRSGSGPLSIPFWSIRLKWHYPLSYHALLSRVFRHDITWWGQRSSCLPGLKYEWWWKVLSETNFESLTTLGDSDKLGIKIRLGSGRYVW